MRWMKVLILGGTGMLGAAAATELLRRGHQVEAVARTPAPSGATFERVKVHALDVFTASEAELTTLLLGVDGLVYALGPDDREAIPAPALAYFQEHLVDQTERIMLAARRAGVKRAALLGSYFCTFDRLHPEWQLAAHHPYVRARVQQAGIAVQAGQGWGEHLHMDVMVLELPYVFGVTPGRLPFWKAVLFDRLRRLPVVLYPRGGTAAVTTTQVAAAVAGALERGQHGAHYPVGDLNLTWNELIGTVLGTLGERRPVVNVPMFLAQQAMRAEQRALTRAGLQGGLSPLHLMPDIMYRHLYLDGQPSQQQLGYAPGGVLDALRDTVRAAYPAASGGGAP